MMRLLAVVYALLLVIPALGASVIAAFWLFPPIAVLGLLLIAMIVFQLKACLRLWNGDYGPIRPGEKNAFGGGALVSTIILSWIFSMGIDGDDYRVLAAGFGLLLTSALLPLTLTAARKRFHYGENVDKDLDQRPAY